MRFSPSRLALAAAVALSLSTAAVAVAQEGPPPGPPPMADHGPGGPMTHRHRVDPEARAQHLRDVLQLRPDQDGALKAYLAALKPKGRGDRKADHADGPRAPLTTPQRLDRQAEHLARASQAFKVRADATRGFYAALSPSQQKAFDVLAPKLAGHGPRTRRSEAQRIKGGPDGAAPAAGKRQPS